MQTFGLLVIAHESSYNYKLLPLKQTNKQTHILNNVVQDTICLEKKSRLLQLVCF